MLIAGLVCTLFPQFLNIYHQPIIDNTLLLTRIGGVFIVSGAIIMMTVIYDINIHLCHKEN